MEEFYVFFLEGGGGGVLSCATCLARQQVEPLQDILFSVQDIFSLRGAWKDFF